MEFTVQTKGNYDLINLTSQVKDFVEQSEVKNGVVVIFAKHTTVGLTLTEWEDGTKQDLIETFERIAPQKGDYHHEKWNDGNGAAHVKSALFPPSLSIPIREGQLDLGIWQNVVLIDFDVKAREREVVMRVIH